MRGQGLCIRTVGVGMHEMMLVHFIVIVGCVIMANKIIKNATESPNFELSPELKHR